MASMLDPFRESFWLTRGWFIRYEQRTNGCIDLHTNPYPLSTFQLESNHPCIVATTTGAVTNQVFKRVRELVHNESNVDFLIKENYFFPQIDKLVLGTDTLLSSQIVCFDYVT